MYVSFPMYVFQHRMIARAVGQERCELTRAIDLGLATHYVYNINFIL